MFSGIGKGTNQLEACRRYAPSGQTDVLSVVTGTWDHVGAIQVQIVRSVSTAGCRGQIVAVATPIAS